MAKRIYLIVTYVCYLGNNNSTWYEHHKLASSSEWQWPS